MGTDKSLLDYHGEPQCYHVYNMLVPLCEKTFISCNSSQMASLYEGYNVIEDLPAFSDSGPVAGLLTAFHNFPNQDFLLIGCDYPFLTSDELTSFIKTINAESAAAAFYNKEEKYYQPVLGWYSSGCGSALFQLFQEQEYSLQGFLKKVQAEKYSPKNPASMRSVDTIESREEAMNHFFHNLTPTNDRNGK